MKPNIITLLTVLFLCMYNIDSFAQTSLNLDFEHKHFDKYWSSSNAGAYELSLDSLEQHEGKYSLRMKMQDTTKGIYDVLLCILPYEKFAGKTVELRGWIKTKDVKNGQAALMYRIDDTALGSLGFETMQNRGLKGNNDWTQLALKMDISSEAKMIYCGGIFQGVGTVWFDDFELYIDGEKYIDYVEPKPKTSLSPKEIAALRKYIYPLRTYEPDNGDTKDLEVLKKLIGKSKVVALGEESHGSAPVFKMKNRIIQYLAENQGFDIFSIEANMPESYKLNDFTVEGKSNPRKLLAGIGPWVWRNEEVLDMVEWMHKYNQSGHRITFTGFDMQHYQGAIDEIHNAFKGNEEVEKMLSDIETRLKKHGGMKIPLLSSVVSQSDSLGKELLPILYSLENHVEKAPFQELQKKWLLQNIVILRQYLGLDDGDFINWRDKSMADNFMWIKEQNPDSKLIIWAHNMHIAKTKFKNAGVPVYTVMGNHLAGKLGDDYVNFGFTSYDGSFMSADLREYISSYKALPATEGTLEYLLNQLDEPIFILDLKRIKTDRTKDTKWLLEPMDYRHKGNLHLSGYLNNFLRQRKIADDYDYLIFIKTSTPSHYFSVSKEQEWSNKNKEQSKPMDGLNLDFESVGNGLPIGWQANGTDDIKFSIDSLNVHGGKYSASIECTDGDSQFGLYGLIIPGNYAGEQVTLSGYIKTENVTDGYAGLIMRVDPEIGSNDVQITGTTEWKKYEVTVKMDDKKNRTFAISAILTGKGKVWFDDLKITIDGEEISKLKLISNDEKSN